MSISRLARFLDDLLLACSEFSGGHISSFCRLESAVDKVTLSADDGTLLSFIELTGSLQLFGPDEFDDALSTLYSTLSPYLQTKGHALQFVTFRDPDGARREVDAFFDPMVATATTLGIDIKSIMNGNADKLAQLTASEHTFVVVWTYPYALPPKTQAVAKKAKRKSNTPKGSAHSMDLSSMDLLKSAHQNFVNAVVGSFQKARLGCNLLSAHQSLHWVRMCICPDLTSDSWLPVLPGDKLPLREPDDGLDPIEGASFPKLKKQLFPRHALTDGEVVEIDNKLHRSCTMELGPQQLCYFMPLFNELLKHPFAWRLSFHISGDGLHGTTIKETLAQILSFTNSENHLLLDSIRGLKELKRAGNCLVRFEANFDTWVDKRKFQTEKQARDMLATQHNYLVAALQTWGGMDVREVVGDPLIPFSATIPGLSLKTPSAKPAAPLQDVLAMMPITRPASPWQKGSFLLRTIDGKLFPVGMLSSLQASWIEIGYGGLGSGKSVWINSTNWAYIFQPGLDELPHLGIIDIGPSSSGLIQLLKNSLPEHQRKYVAAHKLVMSASHTINPFDTPLGCRKPFESQMVFLTNLLSVFCTPEESEHPHEAVGGLVRLCIENAYNDLASKEQKLYQSNLDPYLDEVIDQLNLRVDEHTTWWEIVDQLFVGGHTHEATLAQRYAVPLLTEVQAYTRDGGVRAMYNFKVGSGEDICDYVARKLTEACSKYPIFSRPTKFDLGEARIVSLDLNDVAPKGGSAADRQTGIMYMMAWHLVAGKYFYTEEDPDGIEVVGNPDMTLQYREYHRKQIKKLRSMPKRIVMDEFQRISRSGPIVRQISENLETCTRESRKWLISIGIYSQKIEDMPEAITRLATTHYIIGADSPVVQRELCNLYELNSAGKDALKQIGSPDSRGANCLAIFHTAGGMVQQLVTNTQGPHQMWAYSTTREDMDVRNEMYRRIGPIKALDILARHHPGGVKSYAIQKREEYARQGQRRDVIEDIVEELLGAQS